MGTVCILVSVQDFAGFGAGFEAQAGGSARGVEERERVSCRYPSFWLLLGQWTNSGPREAAKEESPPSATAPSAVPEPAKPTETAQNTEVKESEPGESKAEDKEEEAETLEAPETPEEKAQTLSHVKFFLDFLAKVFATTIARQKQFDDQFRSPLGSGKLINEVTFLELRDLFRVGPIETVATKDPGEDHFTTWQVLMVGGQELLMSHRYKTRGIDLDAKRQSFTIKSGRWYFNGSEFSFEYREFDIRQFAGKRSVRSLSVYPLRYLHPPELEQIKSHGSLFIDYAAEQCLKGNILHKYYGGVAFETEHDHEGEDVSAVN